LTCAAQFCYNPIIEPYSHPLPSRYQNQDSVFARAFDLLAAAIDQHAFPAASVAITWHGDLVCLKSFGHFTYDPDATPALSDTVFDLASLTKPIATTTMAMILYERGLLDLDLPITTVAFEFLTDDPRREAVTFRMLLAHSSGLPAYEKLFLETTNKEELLAKAFATPLVADPGTRTEYSDIGFIILGAALERIGRQTNDSDTLDHFCHREVFGPIGMTRTAFKPPLHWHPRVAPTQDDQTFRLRIIQGEVQDENASVLGGVAGHAGLFSNAPDLALFAEVLLAGGRKIVRPETIALFTRRELSPPGTSRALGWDTPSSPSQSGKYFSPASYGHLGYTGTSLWIDPERHLSITLLTNRTWPDCANQAIKQLRPAFHDAVIEALEQNR
jgi:serine-type D-Ala-D-Ala carboxypeptidase